MNGQPTSGRFAGRALELASAVALEVLVSDFSFE